MQPKKTSKYECHYPSVAEDSAYHYTNCNWQYGDSLRTYHAKYKDSVAVDYDRANMRMIYVAKGEDYNNKNDYDAVAHDMQYYLVPTFMAIMIMLIVFALIVFGDNEIAQRAKRQETILGFINKKKK